MLPVRAHNSARLPTAPELRLRDLPTEQLGGPPFNPAAKAAAARHKSRAFAGRAVRSGAVVLVSRTVVAAPTQSRFHSHKDTLPPRSYQLIRRDRGPVLTQHCVRAAATAPRPPEARPG